MTKTESKSVLVVFGDKLPEKGKLWWRQFDEIIALKSLQEKIQAKSAGFVDIESLINPGSIQEANRLVNELPDLTLADGRKISKSVNWRGYELWWMHYDGLFWKFCLPYTQYRELLLYLKNFKNVYLFKAPSPLLFSYFLRVYNCNCFTLKESALRALLPLPLGIFLQLLISAVFLPWLKIKKLELMVWTSDKISPPYNFEFRNKSVFGELTERKIPFAVFMRSVEPWRKVLENAWRRKRAVIYSSAIIEILHFLSRPFNHFTVSISSPDPVKQFWFLVATHHLRNLKGSILSILTMKFLLRWIGVKAAYINDGCDRTFHEVLGCKLAGIKIVGIQHAATPRHAFISDFMPGFTGELTLSVDKYGLWSDWWRDYYLNYSRAYNPGQLYVSGPSNPMEKEIVETDYSRGGRPLKVLFISEQLAAPEEVMPYLLKLLKTEDFILQIKFRPYRDGFEEWLEKHQPDVLEKVKEKGRIFRGSPQEAAAQSDVVVGSHSSAVLEALQQLKPIVFFWTDKWGDYFGIKDSDKEGRFFANNPEELVQYIRKSSQISQDDLKQLQKQFFGDPNQNGGKWVVEQALEFVKNYGRQ